MRTVVLAPDVPGVIRAMHPDTKRRVRAAIDAIRTDPATGKALVRELDGWWSYRVGQIRIVYRPKGTLIEIALIGPRATVYVDAARKLSRDTALRPSTGSRRDRVPRK